MLFFEPPNLFERFFQKFFRTFFSSALRSIRVAKVRTYFRSSKSFLKIFFRILSEPFLYHSRRSFNRSGCKGKDFFRICKSFLKIFQKFFRTCFCRFRRCFSLEAGAKIRGFGRHFQIFSGLFFRHFSRQIHTLLTDSKLIVKFFNNFEAFKRRLR